MLVDGSNGSVELLDNHIVIRRKGFANVLTQGIQGDKSIPMTSITAVQFRSAGSMMAGLIQFTIVGGREFRGGMLEATKDENAVLFERKQQSQFQALHDAVQQAISRHSRTEERQVTSSADELAKLAGLVEKGYLTREEYDQRKSTILQQPFPSEALREPKLTGGGASNHLRAGEISSQVSIVDHPRRAKKRNPLAIGCALVIAALAILSELGGSLDESTGSVATAGPHWRQVGGLDNGNLIKHIKFVEVSKRNAGRAVYDDAISKLCGTDNCYQVGFFIAGDSIPPSTPRRTFFQNGGWGKYSPAAVYTVDAFNRWDCAKAGVKGAPLSALCGSERVGVSVTTDRDC